MRFEELYTLRTERRLSIEQAAQLLGVSERTFRRWSVRYEAFGAEGLADERLGKLAHNAAGVDEVTQLLCLFEMDYRDFSISHFFDKYRHCHGGTRSYNWVRKQLQQSGLVTKVNKRGCHRRKRPREPMKGMMLHQDGSTHEWVLGRYWDLIVTMDDADNEIYSAFFVEEEGTWSSFAGVFDVITTHGLFCSLYVDRGSHYFYTPKAGGKVDRERPTQFGRAMQQLGIELIAAYSPEARGRSERMFGTLQGRLPQELRLAGIQTIEQANAFLSQTFIPQFNERFRCRPQEAVSAFVPWLPRQTHLEDILCLQESRTVAKDNTVRYQGKTLQIPQDRYRWSYQKTHVMVHEYANGPLAIFYEPRCLARYEAHGDLQAVDTQAHQRCQQAA